MKLSAPSKRTYIYAALLAAAAVMIVGSTGVQERSTEFAINYTVGFIGCWWLNRKPQ